MGGAVSSQGFVPLHQHGVLPRGYSPSRSSPFPWAMVPQEKAGTVCVPYRDTDPARKCAPGWMGLKSGDE